jgi:hypothetical protein
MAADSARRTDCAHRDVMAFTASAPPPRYAASQPVAPRPAWRRRHLGYWAAHGSRCAPTGRIRPSRHAPHGAAAGTVDGVARLIRPIEKRSVQASDYLSRAAYRSPDPAAQLASRALPSPRNRSTASCGSARKAPLSHRGRISSSQRATALATPIRHDGPAGPGPHPQTEAVHAGTALSLLHLASCSTRFPVPVGHACPHDASIGFVSRLVPGAASALDARIAAVSPTFGRLYEGTDRRSPGQTWPERPVVWTLIVH